MIEYSRFPAPGDSVSSVAIKAAIELICDWLPVDKTRPSLAWASSYLQACMPEIVEVFNGTLRADAGILAGMVYCLELGEDGKPACDPLCLACRYRLAYTDGGES